MLKTQPKCRKNALCSVGCQSIIWNVRDALCLTHHLNAVHLRQLCALHFANAHTTVVSFSTENGHRQSEGQLEAGVGPFRRENGYVASPCSAVRDAHGHRSGSGAGRVAFLRSGSDRQLHTLALAGPRACADPDLTASCTPWRLLGRAPAQIRI